MKYINYIISLSLSTILLFSSCRKDCREAEYSHYYPSDKMKEDFSFFLKKGNWWVYEDQHGVTRDSIVVMSDVEDIGESVDKDKPCIYNHAYKSSVNWYHNNTLYNCDFKIKILGGEEVNLSTDLYIKGLTFNFIFFSNENKYKDLENDPSFFSRTNIVLNNKYNNDVLEMITKEYLSGYSNPPTSQTRRFLKEKQGFVGWINGNDTLSLKNSFVQ